jgi:hypothetical protein
MPEKRTVQKAKRLLHEGKSPSTAAGEFVREEIEHIRQGKHGARSTKQAIAIGLSKARRSGVPLSPPEPGQARAETRKSATRDLKTGRKRKAKKTSERRSKASRQALQREPRKAASRQALSKQAKRSTARRKRTRQRAQQRAS